MYRSSVHIYDMWGDMCLNVFMMLRIVSYEHVRKIANAIERVTPTHAAFVTSRIYLYCMSYIIFMEREENSTHKRIPLNLQQD